MRVHTSQRFGAVTSAARPLRIHSRNAGPGVYHWDPIRTCSGRLMPATRAAHVPGWGAPDVGAARVGAAAVDEGEAVAAGLPVGVADAVAVAGPEAVGPVDVGCTTGADGGGVVPQDPTARTSGTRPAARTGRSTRRP